MSLSITYGDFVYVADIPEFVLFTLDSPAPDDRLAVTLSYLREEDGAFIRLPNHFRKDTAGCLDVLHSVFGDTLESGINDNIPVLRVPIGDLFPVQQNRCSHSFPGIQEEIVETLPSHETIDVNLVGSHAIAACSQDSDLDLAVIWRPPLPPADAWITHLLNAGLKRAPIQSSYTIREGLETNILDSYSKLLNNRNPAKFVVGGQPVDVHLANPTPPWLNNIFDSGRNATVIGRIEEGTLHGKPSKFVVRPSEPSQNLPSELTVISYLHVTRLLRVGDVVTLEGATVTHVDGSITLVMSDLQVHGVAGFTPRQTKLGGEEVGARS